MAGKLWTIGDISPSPEDQKVLGSGVKSPGLDWRVLEYGDIMAEDSDQRTRRPRRPHSIWRKRSIMGVQGTEV